MVSTCDERTILTLVLIAYIVFVNWIISTIIYFYLLRRY